jgi:hypothetical protein
MLNLYSNDMANALQSFDRIRGINRTLSVFTTTGRDNYVLLNNSMKICN